MRKIDTSSDGGSSSRKRYSLGKADSLRRHDSCIMFQNGFFDLLPPTVKSS